jgi:hypothetical protein
MGGVSTLRKIILAHITYPAPMFFAYHEESCSKNKVGKPDLRMIIVNNAWQHHCNVIGL